MAPKQRMTGIARRQFLLEQSKCLFGEKGYHDASTSQIASRSGVSEPVLYAHFDNKKHLFITALHEFGMQFEDQWRAALEAHTTTDPLERLAQILIEYRRAAQADPAIQRMIFDGFSEARDPEIAAAVRSNFNRFRIYVTELILEAQAAGSIAATVNPKIAAWGFVSATCTIQALLMLNSEHYFDDAAVQEFTDLWLKALKS